MVTLILPILIDILSAPTVCVFRLYLHCGVMDLFLMTLMRSFTNM